VSPRLIWDEAKRQANPKHGFDSADAEWVLESDIRMDSEAGRHGERRIQSFAYAYNRLAVLTVVHVPSEAARIVSFRAASIPERRTYYEWLDTEYKNPR